jgi:Lrp/AsnC family transcriptional regulator, cysteine-sensing transcriptional activator
MDRIDLGILNLLQEDATLSSNEIARRLDVPPTSCWRRVKALEEAGIIRKRVALVDPNAVGVGTVAFVFIRTGQHEPS